jgi:biopolymer transport protein ExbD
MGLLPRPRDLESDAPDETSIPLAPLVDIVFLLLIFFLVATTYLDEERDLGLVLPRVTTSGGAPGTPKLERVLLNVRADGTVLLGRVPVGREALYSELVAARRANEAVPVVIRGDRSASHGDMASVYALCQRAGVRNVAVVVEPTATGTAQVGAGSAERGSLPPSDVRHPTSSAPSGGP